MIRRPSKSGRKIAFAGIAFLVALAAGLLVIPSLFYLFEYVRRVVFWASSDVYDYQESPERKLEKGEPTYRFARNWDVLSICRNVEGKRCPIELK